MKVNCSKFKNLLAFVAFAATVGSLVAQNAGTSGGAGTTVGGQQTTPAGSVQSQSSATFNGSQSSQTPGGVQTPQAPGGIETPQAPGGIQTPQAPGGTLVPPPGSSVSQNRNASQGFITNGSGGFFTNGNTAGTFTNGFGTSSNGTATTFTNNSTLARTNGAFTNSAGFIVVPRNGTNTLRRQPLNNPQ